MVIIMVVHNHSETETQKDVLKKVLDYWKKPKQYQFESDIVEIQGDWLKLKYSLFYPEGGGQPADRGYIIYEAQKIKVIDVQKRGKKIWIHVPNHNLSENYRIEGRIDKKRREKLSRNHSSQHLLSAAFWEEFEFDTLGAEIGIYESHIDLDKTPTLEQVTQVIDIVDEKIIEKLPITSRYITKTELKNYKLRGSIELDEELYRMVEIGTYDRNLCGGVHLENTVEIGALTLSKIEGKKIRFVSGIDAFRILNQSMKDLQSISRIIGASPKQSPAKVEEISASKTVLERKINKLNSQIAKYEANISPWEKYGEFFLKIFALETADRGMILDALGQLHKNQIACVISQSGIFILTSGSEIITQDLMKRLQNKGIKSGGKGLTIMGKLKEIDLEVLKIDILDALDI